MRVRTDTYLARLNDARVSSDAFFSGAGVALFELLLSLLLPAPTSMFALLCRFFLYVGYVAAVVGTVATLLPLSSFRSYHGNAIRAFFLGLVFGAGLILAAHGRACYWRFGLYLCLLAFFHWSEYYVTSRVNPAGASLDFYLLSHSAAYQIAAVASWVEFWFEALLLPRFKCGLDLWVVWPAGIGLLLCLAGEGLRKAAMLTATSNFNHYIQHVRKHDHVLVTHGVYSWCRHPAYVGWFYWSVGTQLLLGNPCCAIGYLIASWTFFHGRVHEEEVTLLNFFGEQYSDYQRRVPTGLPFIQGYRLDIP